MDFESPSFEEHDHLFLADDYNFKGQIGILW